MEKLLTSEILRPDSFGLQCAGNVHLKPLPVLNACLLPMFVFKAWF